MTDYNDGKWHGWNGGECPVHPKSVVEIRYENADYDGTTHADALSFSWRKFQDGNGICAFRVIKAYREPRECWSYGAHLHDTLADAETFRAAVDKANPGNGYKNHPIKHWVEVVE